MKDALREWAEGPGLHAVASRFPYLDLVAAGPAMALSVEDDYLTMLGRWPLPRDAKRARRTVRMARKRRRGWA